MHNSKGLLNGRQKLLNDTTDQDNGFPDAINFYRYTLLNYLTE